MVYCTWACKVYKVLITLYSLAWLSKSHFWYNWWKRSNSGLILWEYIEIVSWWLDTRVPVLPKGLRRCPRFRLRVWNKSNHTFHTYLDNCVTSDHISQIPWVIWLKQSISFGLELLTALLVIYFIKWKPPAQTRYCNVISLWATFFS